MWMWNCPDFAEVEHTMLNSAIYLRKKIFQRKTRRPVIFTFDLILDDLSE